MIIYANNRSMKLPRKHKRRVINSKAPVIAPYRADDLRSIPSQFERRCANGRWLERDELIANEILDAIIYGERGA